MKGVDSARCVILLCVITCCTGVRLAPCQSGVVEMLRNADNLSFTCDQYSGTVTWYFARHNTPNMLESIGTCNTRRCQVNKRWVQGGGFSLKFLTATSSRLMLSKPVTERHYRWTYGCDDSQGIDNLTFTSTHWNVQGSSDVINVYSSLGRYSCELRERRETGHVTVLSNATLTLTPDPNDIRNTQDRRGTCSFSKRLPTDDGNYTYTVVVSPGNRERTVGSVEIGAPYVPGHNTSVVCTCNTRSVGRPEGRLRWFRGSGNNNPINSGNYGDTSLIMTPQTLTQADYDVTTFHCDVDWVETVSGGTHVKSRFTHASRGLSNGIRRGKRTDCGTGSDCCTALVAIGNHHRLLLLAVAPGLGDAVCSHSETLNSTTSAYGVHQARTTLYGWMAWVESPRMLRSVAMATTEIQNPDLPDWGLLTQKVVAEFPSA
ncbi:hypothetical protein BaRGS_00031212 [Batillaria attramentaria]|uniref:Ig-like domain-containing protein n=1 Tax=Batillaria attramentaria TaxID=370345 RepID=A0ABD0JSG5_9CAEN